jgi:hypothetical protein
MATALRGGSARRLRGSAIRLEETLVFGLRFGFTPDPELATMRGHARNVGAALRREVDAGLQPGAGPEVRSAHLRRADALLDDLVATVWRIDGRVLDLEARSDETWRSTWAGRLLAVAAALLPPERRRPFLEDQCGNLAQAASRREWLGYLLGVVAHMPDIAAASLAAADRESAAGLK